MTPRQRIVLGVLVAVAVLLAVSLLFVVVRPSPRYTASRFDAASGTYVVGSVPGGAEPVVAAAAVARAVLRYDPGAPDEQLAEATRLMTPSFASDFRAAFTNAVHISRTPVVAVIIGAGLIDRAGTHADVLVFADQRLAHRRSNGSPHERTVAFRRVRITLDLVGGAWLASAIKSL